MAHLFTASSRLISMAYWQTGEASIRLCKWPPFLIKEGTNAIERCCVLAFSPFAITSTYCLHLPQWCDRLTINGAMTWTRVQSRCRQTISSRQQCTSCLHNAILVSLWLATGSLSSVDGRGLCFHGNLINANLGARL